MADDNLFQWVAVGGLGYLIYRYWLKPSAAAPSAAPTSGTPPMYPGGTQGGPLVGPAPLSLDQIYQRLQGAIQASAASDPAISISQGAYIASPQTFSSYLSRAGGVDVSGALGTLFPSQVTVSLAQFWTAAAAWLSSNKGLSGGLGFYGTVFQMAPRRAV